MTANGFRFRVGLVFLAASGLVLAQDQPPGSNGGWRRVSDTPQAAPAQRDPAPMDSTGTDAYGQPIQAPPQAPPQAAPQANAPGQFSAPPNDRPTYGLPAQLTLKPGTYVTVRTNQFLSTDRNQSGDTFSGTLAQPIVVDGIVLAERGQTVYGRVAEAQKQHSGKSSRLGLELTGLTLVDGTQATVRSQLVARQGTTTPTGVQVGTVAATTTVGAAVGAAADYGTGAAIGAGVGAAAGLIGVLATRNHPTVVYPESALTFQIESPVTVSTARAPQSFRYVSPDDYSRPVNNPQMVRRPMPMGAYSYGPGYYPAYPYPYPYPYYPYWGGISLGWGRGFFYGRGFYRGWR
ncbi:MAG TPA: hypothetical protein VE959_00675 [Bryobacteraceae bacterium]|nr:hypothetical protein [Bryobacteraceae bacterium]